MNGRRQFIQKLLALGATTAASYSGLSWANTTPSTTNNTGVVLDELFLKHTMKGHPESAERLIAIDRALEKHDLWNQLSPVAARMAKNEELLWAHSQTYIDEIEHLSQTHVGYYDPYHEDTYINAASFDAARTAAGAAIELNLAVYDRKVDNGFALLRPPGHHALKDKAMGFCIFNSDVIAARALQQYRGIERVAIVDFDVHHGNGTQDMTINDPSIMAVSIHQHPYWPMTGGMEWVGESEAKGTNVNCPFIRDAGDETYLKAFNEIIYPKLKAFKPQHIIVFAGYDGHWRDPLAQHLVSVDGYNQLVSRLKQTAQELCGGRLSLSLGGGYDVETLGHCVTGSMQVLLGQTPTADALGPSPDKERDFSKHLKKLKAVHKTT